MSHLLYCNLSFRKWFHRDTLLLVRVHCRDCHRRPGYRVYFHQCGLDVHVVGVFRGFGWKPSERCPQGDLPQFIQHGHLLRKWGHAHQHRTVAGSHDGESLSTCCHQAMLRLRSLPSPNRERNHLPGQSLLTIPSRCLPCFERKPYLHPVTSHSFLCPARVLFRTLRPGAPTEIPLAAPRCLHPSRERGWACGSAGDRTFGSERARSSAVV
mmetsp:Transcript_62804/g.168021  ORF Transcript_62804/g.168021 Transcript_62804/m.168021 type:complete len:211 (+) Transcript_62804:457-1089(+)